MHNPLQGTAAIIEGIRRNMYRRVKGNFIY